MDKLAELSDWLRQHVEKLQNDFKKYPSDYAAGRLHEAEEILQEVRSLF
jgi:hypothetical protein